MEPLLPGRRVHGRHLSSRKGVQKGHVVLIGAGMALFLYGTYIWLKKDNPKKVSFVRKPVSAFEPSMNTIESNLTHPVFYEGPNELEEQRWNLPGLPGLDGMKDMFMGSIGFGFLLGFATGFAVFITQLLARGKVIHVDWRRINEDFNPKLAGVNIPHIRDLLHFDMPFAGSFGVAFLLGFNWE